MLENRRRLAASFGASPADFVFAGQVHEAGVRVVGEPDRGRGAFSLEDAVPGTDALVTTSPAVVLAILTADCVPIVLHDPVAGVLACVHAGWRGTAAGVAAAAVAAMQALGSRPSDVIAGIGPAIAPARYQVGPDVHQAVTQAFGSAASAVMRPDPVPARWRLDLWAANRLALREAGVPDPQIHINNPPHRPHCPHRPHRSHRPSRSSPPPQTISTPQAHRPPQALRTPPAPPTPATSSVTAQPAPAAGSPWSPACGPGHAVTGATGGWMWQPYMALSGRLPQPLPRGRVFRYGSFTTDPDAGC